MKKILPLLAVFCMFPAAALAQVTYYLLEQTQDSVDDDGYLAVEYELTSIKEPLTGFIRFAGLMSGAIAEGGFPSGFPQPRMSFILTNRSDQEIVVDLQQSTFRRNDHETAVCDLIVSKTLVLKAHSTERISDINILSEECQGSFDGVYFYRPIPGSKKNGNVCMACKSELKVGAAVSYSERNTPIRIGTTFAYYMPGDENLYGVATSYYASKKIRGKVSSKWEEKESILDKAVPDWRDEKYEIIRLWEGGK